MKRLLFSILFISITIQCLAQQLEKQSIVSAALQSSRIEYTIGELVVGDFANGDNVMSYAFTMNDVVLATEPDQLFNSLFIYPNPANDELIIQSIHSIMGYQVIDMIGNFMLEQRNDIPQKNFLEISTSKVPAGTYILRVKFSNGSTSKVKFIKVK